MDEYKTVVRVLVDVTTKGRSLDACLKDTDTPLSKQIVYGVLRDYYRLNGIVGSLMDKPLAEKHVDLHLLILAGIYSIDSLNRPDHASVNATVNTTKSLKKVWAKKLVNGVLRNYQRHKTSIDESIGGQLEVRTHHPGWLANRIIIAYPSDADRIFDANNQQPPMTLRANIKQISRDDYLALLEEKGISATAGNFASTAIYLSTPTSVTNLPGFKEGMVSVQDEASQLAVTLLNLEPGLSLLDACAAPGGKTCALLEASMNLKVTALDISQDRLVQIRENLARLSLKAEVIAMDLLEFETTLNAPLFDRILLDVPCSATGIIRRHPDIKLLRQDADIDKLATTQDSLLAKAWSLLNINGELLYSTCSILPEENEQVIDRFASTHPEAVVMPIEATWGIGTVSGRQLLPGANAPDGFFFARLKKRTL